MLKNSFKFLIVLIFFGFHWSHGKVNPALKWKKIETSHFEIIFTNKNIEIAKKYAKYCEIAYDLLIPIFKEAPAKTAVVINDSTDLANGYATFLPYPHIVIYPTLPLPDSTISSYDHWGLGLMIHEYTHILSFYPAHGIYTPFKYIFGTVVRPAAITPRWYLEGLAVAMETRFTTQGRLRSPDTQAAIKAYIKDQKLYDMTVDRWNEGADEWPFGGSPYLFGSIFWQKAINEKGESSVYRLLQSNARKLPFRLNSSFKKLYDSSVQDFLTEMYIEAEERFKPGQQGEKQLSLRQGHRLIDLSLSPNKKLLLSLQTSPDDGTRILLHKRTKNNQFDLRQGKTLTGVFGTERIGWFKNSKKIYYDAIAVGYDRFNSFYSLNTYDLESKKSKKIPKTQRSFQAHISPNQKRLVFIKNGAGQNQLVISDSDGSNQKVLLSPKVEVRLSYPTFVDNENIIFTMRNFKGEQKLFTIHSETKKIKKLDTENNSIFKIKKSGNNFIFVSDTNGTKNLWAAKPPFEKIKALTNTDTSVSSGEWDSIAKKLYFSQLTSKGNKAFVLTKNKLASEDPKKVQPVVAYAWPKKIQPIPKSDIKLEVKEYSPLKYLLPRYWIPYAYNVNDGFVFQGTTFVKDPIDKHSYSLGVSFDTITEHPSYSFSYQNGSTDIDVLAAFSLFNEPISSGSSDFFKRTSFLLGAGFFLPGASNNWRGSISWSHRETNLNSTGASLDKVTGPVASVNYGNTRSFGRNLKKGFVSFSASHSHNLDLDGFLNFDMTTMNALYNFNHFLPRQHYLLLRFNGAYSDNLPLDGTLITYGARTIGGNFIANLVNSNVLMRGYTSGAFAAQKMAVGSVGYDFPLGGSIFKGPGLTPVFFKRFRGHVFTDAITLKGRYLFTPDTNIPARYEPTNFDEVFVGSGAEIKMATTLGYHLPVEFILGLYYGFNREASGGFIPFISFSMGSLGGLSNE